MLYSGTVPRFLVNCAHPCAFRAPRPGEPISGPVVRAGDAIVVCVLGLLCVGVVMVNSAGLAIEPGEGVTFQSIVWSRSTVYMLLAVAAMAIATRLPLGWLAKAGSRPGVMLLVLVGLFAALLTVYMPVIGREVNGSHRWVRIPGINQTMQPSEVVKWGLIVVLAWYGSFRASQMSSFRRGLMPGLLISMPLAGLIAMEDLGTGVIVAAVACTVLIAAGARVWHLLAFVPLGVVCLALAVTTSSYRVRRVMAFMDPYSDPEGSGYHMIQSLVAVANGQGFGRGLGFGLQKFGYLPEDRTDFLFAVICEELGIAGAVGVIALLGVLMWSGASVVLRTTNPMLRLMGLGIVATFGFQAVMNLTVVTGLAPTKGIALPLLSSGGTGWILTAFAFGLLVSVDRENQNAVQVDQAGTESVERGLTIPPPRLAA